MNDRSTLNLSDAAAKASDQEGRPADALDGLDPASTARMLALSIAATAAALVDSQMVAGDCYEDFYQSLSPADLALMADYDERVAACQRAVLKGRGHD